MKNSKQGDDVDSYNFLKDPCDHCQRLKGHCQRAAGSYLSSLSVTSHSKEQRKW